MKARIIAMNQKYELPVNHVPTLRSDTVERLYKFKKILSKEIDEVDDILDVWASKDEVELLTMIADLLADIIVYFQSEAVRYGIPLDEVLQIVMDSDGKFLKGPNFVPPEPAIRKLLLEKMNAND